MALIDTPDKSASPPPPSYNSEPQPRDDNPAAIRNDKPGNNIYISRNFGVIKESFVIDPQYDPKLPSHVLSKFKLKDGEKKRNLKLHSDFGCVDVDVWIHPGSKRGAPAEHAEKTRTLIDVSSEFRSVAVKVYASPKGPFRLAASTAASIDVYLPRTFPGPLVAESEFRSVHYSPGVSENLTVLAELKSTQHCFIGDYEASKWREDAEHWEGDVVRLKGGLGRIRVAYIDETWPMRSWLSYCVIVFGTLLSGVWFFA